MRIRGYCAAAISVCALTRPVTGNSMFDWPDATQTSLTRMSLSVIVFVALTSNGNGPPASPGERKTLQRPSSAAVVDFVSPRNVAETASCGAAMPQTCTGSPRWITMWSASRAGSVTSAWERVESENTTAISRNRIGSECNRKSFCIMPALSLERSVMEEREILSRNFFVEEFGHNFQRLFCLGQLEVVPESVRQRLEHDESGIIPGAQQRAMKRGRVAQ